MSLHPDYGREVAVSSGPVTLPGLLAIPDQAIGLVLFAHGSGSSRLSVRNNRVAADLRSAGLATLLFDLLTEPESASRVSVFDIPLLAERLAGATDWALAEAPGLPVGYFGASTGAAAALVAATARGDLSAIVSRGGRPDLAGGALPRVTAPTLLIVGSRDEQVLGLNRQALAKLTCEKRLAVVPGATHLFEEPGALDQVSVLAKRWFAEHLFEANDLGR